MGRKAEGAVKSIYGLYIRTGSTDDCEYCYIYSGGSGGAEGVENVVSGLSAGMEREGGTYVGRDCTKREI